MFFVCHVISLDHVIKESNGFRHCGSGDRMVLVCHMISQDHVIKRSCDLMCGSPSRQVTILQCWVMVWVCHAISQNHVIKESYLPSNEDPETIAKNFAKNIKTDTTKVAISGIIPRRDTFHHKAKQVNQTLKKLCEEENIPFIWHHGLTIVST